MNLPPALVARFRLHLAETLAEVRRLDGNWPVGGVPPQDSLERLGRIAHKLAGTAEPYGFAEVGACAQEVQALIRSGDAQPRTALKTALDRLAQALDQAAR